MRKACLQGCPPVRSASDLLALAMAGGAPGVFEVGCTVPMAISHDTAAGNLAIGPLQAMQIIGLVLTPTTRALTTIVWTEIRDAMNKSTRMEGTNLSGINYSVEQFTFEALRSDANPWPNTRRNVSNTNPLTLVFDGTSVGILSGQIYGFIQGMDGIEYACSQGWMGQHESNIYRHLAIWQKSGKIPGELMDRLCAANESGVGAAALAS